jgi:hypothetical protein
MTAPVEEAPPLVTPRPASLRVQPGVAGSLQVAITNQGSVVDEFAVDLLGDPAPWGTTEPPTVSLVPGQEGVVTITVVAPKGPAALAGPHLLAIRARSTRYAAASTVEEVTIDVAPAPDLAVRLVPSARSGSGGATYRVDVENDGNVSLEVRLSGYDPDELVKVKVEPSAVTAEPGMRVRVKAKVSAVEPFFRGPSVQRGFVVEAVAGQVTATANGKLNQGALLGGLVVPAATGLIALAVLAFALNNDLIKLPGGGAAPTSPPAATVAPQTAAPSQPTPAPTDAPPPSTGTPSPTPLTVTANGTLTFDGAVAKDLDDPSAAGAAPDIKATKKRSPHGLLPLKDATLGIAGKDLTTISLFDCKRASNLAVYEIAPASLTVGTNLCAQTNGGGLTFLVVKQTAPNLVLEYTTWALQP